MGSDKSQGSGVPTGWVGYKKTQNAECLPLVDFCNVNKVDIHYKREDPDLSDKGR